MKACKHCGAEAKRRTPEGHDYYCSKKKECVRAKDRARYRAKNRQPTGGGVIDCTKKGCDKTRTVLRVKENTVELCAEHLSEYNKERKRAYHLKNKALKESKVRVDCDECDGYRMVVNTVAWKALPYCDEHMRLRKNRLERLYQQRKKLLKTMPKSKLMTVAGDWPRLRILPSGQIAETLEDGNFPDNIVFQDTETKTRYTVVRVGESQELRAV